METKFSVIVVEDELETRERLVRVISSSSKFECLTSCSDVQSSRKALLEFKPDLVLLDIDLPDGSGLELLHYLAEIEASTRAVVVTVFEDSRHITEAISHGAAGYVLKDDPSISIEEALLMIIEGGAPISPAIARQILLKFKDTETLSNQDAQDELKNIESLTEREREILIKVSDGFTDKEIADKESISYHTVTTHVKHIYKKLSIKTRVEATRQAIKHGIADPANK
ncbi:MAG: response regulator transcription factor [Acidiferrobacterales bacterium]|nr:response regulator transcription factor [Acidiferrobacterales bacterium]